ncbi:MAG: TrkH family potassium uptake protein [Proteobacteria bacterium]|nr:TrkH family potassium uptake protein [Desulfobacteraceae bacterium]MBU4002560.1 TrkH family potassium uptake protein [Pseudomonadota bacterium]MBU4055092.1 TrkH family potassium uptake protein [Pseudomonadota bacterium]MBU4318890.1 TrkH family potassium uptake protein [Pseudomonadota bacterium]MBU4469570.1 TrkH family potassium uptake protein [Pseudomonadota bacterium]
MRWRYILSVIGILTAVLGLTMILPLLVGVLYRDSSVKPFLYAMAITVSSGLILYFFCRRAKAEIISQREGMAIVAIGWTVIGLFGALPFYLEGGEFRFFVDALFESVSGFTTTGSSILTNVEGISKGSLFWRSLIQWLGGMGIIVLSVAILPFLGVGGMQLYKAEVPSPIPDKLRPRIRDTAMVLWKVYALISLGQVILLMAGGMGPFDSLCHTFTTMPTGGFSTKNASVAHFNSAYFDGVMIVFMVLAGINFSLHYQFMKGNTLAFWKDSECRFFLGIVVGLMAIVSFDLHGKVYSSVGSAFRYGSFQVVSILTTTGYATADYEQWPAMSQLILLLCMFLGASAGSTGGGMKCLRVMLCFKFCYKELFSLIHPHAVMHVKIGGRSVPEDVMRSVMGFLALYVGLFALSSVLLAGMGVDFITSFSAVAATIGNIGPGFGMVGPVENFAAIPFWGKWLLIWCMLLGRLEIYTIIILMVPEFWRK